MVRNEEAAASAMAAVAAAAAAASVGSPSAAAAVARSTVRNQPLLSAHALTPPSGRLPSTNRSPRARHQQRQVAEACVRIDLAALRAFLGDGGGGRVFKTIAKNDTPTTGETKEDGDRNKRVPSSDTNSVNVVPNDDDDDDGELQSRPLPSDAATTQAVALALSQASDAWLRVILLLSSTEAILPVDPPPTLPASPPPQLPLPSQSFPETGNNRSMATISLDDDDSPQKQQQERLHRQRQQQQQQQQNLVALTVNDSHDFEDEEDNVQERPVTATSTNHTVSTSFSSSSSLLDESDSNNSPTSDKPNSNITFFRDEQTTATASMINLVSDENEDSKEDPNATMATPLNTLNPIDVEGEGGNSLSTTNDTEHKQQLQPQTQQQFPPTSTSTPPPSLSSTPTHGTRIIEENEEIPTKDEVPTQIRVASELMVQFYMKLTSSYDELVQWLPCKPEDDALVEHGDDDLNGRVVYDLLPPCISDADATAAFFGACSPRTKEVTEVRTIEDEEEEEEGNNGYYNNTNNQNSSAPRRPFMNGTSNNSTDKAVTNNSAGNSSVSTATSSSVGKTTAMSMVNAIAGAATGVVENIMTGSSASSNNKKPSIMRLGVGRNNNSSNSDHQASNELPSNRMARSKKRSTNTKTNSRTSTQPRPPPAVGSDYAVTISREMLGLTVENVLERTIVRTVLANGAAKKAGAVVGSLIVKVGRVDTAPLTHFETIDELRQSQRPLRLVLRQVENPALQKAREEMGRLIKGAGFGGHVSSSLWSPSLGSWWGDAVNDNDSDQPTHRKDEAEDMEKTGERLVWIFLLLVVGLEREVTCKKAEDEKKTVIKILLDYVTRRSLGDASSSSQLPTRTNADLNSNRLLLKGRHPKKSSTSSQQSTTTPSPNTPSRSSDSNPDPHAFPIGDALHRARSILSDPYSAPAALLRGETIRLLCDVLDGGGGNTPTAYGPPSSEDEESDSHAHPGVLLKSIVRNCALMRSPEQFCKDPSLHSSHAGNRFLAVVHRLAASRSTGARIAACSLGPVLWGHLDFPHQLQLRGVITRALHDVEVTVRKSTAAVLHEIAELVLDRRAVPWLVLMCERAMTDPDPQLRSRAMTLTWHLAEHLPNAFVGKFPKKPVGRDDPNFTDIYLLQCKLLPVATRLAEDRSFQVRLAVAAQCDRLCAALGDHWSSVIVDLLQALLGDADERVRAEAILCLPRLVDRVLSERKPNVDNDFYQTHNGVVLESLLPTAQKLLGDSSPTVRTSLATSSGELLTLLVGLSTYEDMSSVVQQHNQPSSSAQNKKPRPPVFKRHVDETLIPLVQRLLHDSDPEVTSAALRAVTNASRGKQGHHSHAAKTAATSTTTTTPVFRPVLSEAQVLRLLPTLSDLATSSRWRVRRSAVEIVPALLGCTKTEDTRSRIARLCLQLTVDPVHEVRRAAAECLCLGAASDDDFRDQVVGPHLRKTLKSPHYTQRQLCLRMIEVLLRQTHPHPGPTISSAVSSYRRSLLEAALSLKSDPVVNVRLNVGRVMADVLDDDEGDALNGEYCVFATEDLQFILEELEAQRAEERILSNDDNDEGQTNPIIRNSKPRGPDRDVLYYADLAIRNTRRRLRKRSPTTSSA